MRGAPRLALARAAVIVLCAASVRAERLSENWELSLSDRARVELWNWFEPPRSVPPGRDNNDYVFYANQLRVGLAYRREWLDAFFELQNTALVSLPDDAVAPPPQGPLGVGGTYFAHNRRRDDASVFTKQGYLTVRLGRVGLEGLSLTAGRFEFSDGLEVLTGDPTLDWLKRVRAADRLIGPFGWTHVQRSFDGARLAYDASPLNLTFVASHPTQGGFDLDGLDEISDIDLLYAAVTVTRPAWLPREDARLFWVGYGDGRDVTKVDNRSPALAAADRQDIWISTWGAHFLSAREVGPGAADLLLWGAFQHGEWGTLEHAAWAFALEAGYQLPLVAWKPWLRAGVLRSSGDDEPADRDHDTFFQILPTARLYSLSSFYNLMNDEDYFVQLVQKPMPGLSWRTDFHVLRLTEGRDLWYQGGGATLRKRIFGFSGRPAFGERGLMDVVETALSYDVVAGLNASIYYGHGFGGRVVKEIFSGAAADYGYVEVTVKR